MSIKKKDLNDQFKATWLRFNANLSALWIFSQEIAGLAEQWDEQMIHELAANVADLFDDDPVEVEKEIREFIPAVSELEIEPDYRENASAREIISAFQTGEFQQRAIRWVTRNPYKGYKLLEVINIAFNQPPANGILLRRSALVSLIGFLELLVQDLYSVYYTSVVGSAPPASSGSSDGNVDAQVKKAMGGGWKARVEFFKTLGVDIGFFANIMDDLLEIAQRRNLIVHKDGIIDADYLSRTPAQVIQGKAFIPGRRVLISNSYLLHALEQVHYFGAGLHQLCWRTWVNNSTQAADRSYENFIFYSLQKERYEMVQELAKFGQRLGMEKGADQVNDVNLAIALREMGQEAEAQQIIAGLKRARPTWKIKIAIAVLDRNDSHVHLLLNHAAQQRELKDINPDWPLFKPIRDQAWFTNLFKLDQGTPKVRSY